MVELSVGNFNMASLTIWLYSLMSVVVVSLLSLVGVVFLLLKQEDLKKFVLYLVSFSAGGLFGNVFIHLIPEAVEEVGLSIQFSLLIFLGITVSFVAEKFLQWRHCHIPTTQEHPHSFAYMNLLGDAIHNFIDGLIIGGSYLSSVSLGVATTLAVVLHEIPQEIGDFGVLIYGKVDKLRALLFNFSTALTAIVGAIVALSLGFLGQDFSLLLIPFAAGNFVYVAGSDLIPELRKEEPEIRKSALELILFILGFMTLLSLTLLN